MNLDNAKNAQADILRKVLGYQDVNQAYSLDDQDYPAFAPQFEERIVTEASDGVHGSVSKSHWDRRALIGIGIRPPQESTQESRQKKAERDGARPSEKGFGIAVFVQRPSLLHSRLVRDSVELAKGEAEVFVTGPVSAPGAMPAPRVRGPLEIGCSVGHPSTTAGTLGCFAVDGAEMGAISNAHVFAPGLYSKVGDSSLSPGVRDGGRDPHDAFGQLTRVIPIDYSTTGDNRLDCAWSRLNDSVAYDQFSLKGAGSRGAAAQLTRTPAALLKRDRVGKIGRTTNLSWGEIIAFNTSVTVRMHAPGFSKPAAFSGQIAAATLGGRFSQPGDSGALIFNDNFDPAGLLFAGSSAPVGGEFLTYANPISEVLAALHVSL